MPYIHDAPAYPSSDDMKRYAQHQMQSRQNVQQSQRSQPRDSFGSLYAVESELNAGYQYQPHRQEDMDMSAGTYDDVEDSDDDFTLHARRPRMSFNGRPYPPIPPEGRTLPPPADDFWATVDTSLPVQPAQDWSSPAFAPTENWAPARSERNWWTPVQVEQTYQPSVQRMYASSPIVPPSFGRHRNNDYYVPNVGNNWGQPAYMPNHALPWSPNGGYPPVQPTGYRAPVLHPRHVQLSECPITPHDTYRYPTAHMEQIYIPDEPTKEQLNLAMATWYVDQVILHLVKPGMFRTGTGGQSDEVWGSAGREREAWYRIGRSPPDYSKPWGRMGMTESPAQPHSHSRSTTRRPDAEAVDPYDVLWNNRPERSATLVAFVNDMLQRMSISPMAVVAATWYIAGLGLHDGDGKKGNELRAALREQRWEDHEAVEKRVAMLGLLLAGKWLDDNSFLTKSWNEVTLIPKRDIDRLERAALADLHFSLFVPVSSWVDHVNKHFAVLAGKDMLDEFDAITVPILDRMVTEARETELDDPKLYVHDGSVELDRRLSSDVQLAADQAISRDWGSFARSYAINDPTSIQHQYSPRGYDYGYSSEVDVEMELGRQVSALVDEEVFENEEEEEFLDYDGAKPWLPTTGDLRRSASNSSAQSFDSNVEICQWRSGVYAPSQPASSNHSRNTSASGQMWLPSEERIEEVAQLPGRTQRYEGHDGVYLEPGIEIVRPPVPGLTSTATSRKSLRREYEETPEWTSRTAVKETRYKPAYEPYGPDYGYGEACGNRYLPFTPPIHCYSPLYSAEAQ